MKSRPLIALLTLLMLLPLAVGAGIALSRDWSPAGSGSAAAPAGGDMVAARRAVGEAGAQAGLLAAGAQQLSDGTAKLADGAPKLADGAKDAAAGAQELYDGLVQLQAGTGQLGDGATKLADGVGAAVDNIVGVNAVRGQIIAAIDSTLRDLEGNNSAEAKNIKAQLQDLRAQADNFKLDDSLSAQLKELKTGSRELANQLDVEGYAYHDGIYKAAQGAKDLSTGLKDLDKGAQEATQGTKDLNTGADKVNTMAHNNQDKLRAAQSALPTATAAETPALSPVVAVLLAALAAMGGIALGGRKAAVIVVGTLALTVAGVVGLFVMSSGLSGVMVLACAAAFAATALLFATATGLLIRACGPVGGMLLSALGGIVQLGVVGWLWKSTDEVAGAVRLGTNLLPLNWSTAALTSATNAGPQDYLWGSIIVLGAAAILGVFLSFLACKDERTGQMAQLGQDF